MGLISKVAAFFGIYTFGDFIRFMSLRALEGILVILLITFLPGLPPHAKFETPYSLAPVMSLDGKLRINGDLNNAEHWHKGDFNGPESFAEYNGELYTSLQGGDVVKLTGEKHVTPVVNFGKPCRGYFDEKTCGRPLGLTFDKNGNLYVTDAYYGIFKVDIKSGKKEELVSPEVEIDEKRPKLFNSLVVTNAGDIYWTDSSTEYDLSDGMYDMLSDGSGRLVHFDPKTRRNTVLIRNLHFANGLALSENEDFLIVAETARNRVHRYYLKGSKIGKSDIFLDGIPGTPDNIKADGHGGFFLSLAMAHDNVYPNPGQILGQFPRVRKFISRLLGLSELGFRVFDQVLPNDYAKIAQHVIGHFSSITMLMNGTRVTILHLDNDGDIIKSYHADNGIIMGISEAFVFKDHLVMGSPFNNYIARVPLKDLSLEHLKEKKMRQEHVKPLETKQAPTTKNATPSKPQTTTQAPKAPTPTQAPKAQTPPPATQAPKTQTPPPTTQAPKKQTPPTTEAPKKQTAPPTQAPKKQTPPPTQAPKKQTPPPTQAPKKQAPPPTTQAPQKQTPPPTTQAPKKQAPPTATQAPPTKQTPPPTTKSPPPSKPTATQSKPIKNEPKAVPIKNAPKIEL